LRQREVPKIENWYSESFKTYCREDCDFPSALLLPFYKRIFRRIRFTKS